MKRGKSVHVFLIAVIFAVGLFLTLPVHAGLITPYAATTNQNSNWIKNLTLGADPEGLNYYNRGPKIAVSGQYVHVVWEADPYSGGNTSLVYMRSTDGGKTFEEVKQLAVDAPEDFFGLDFKEEFKNLVADGPYLHIFFTVGWPQKLMYLRSSDNGATFDAPVTLSSGHYGYAVYATAESGKVAVGWTLNGDDSPQPRGLYCSHSSNGGASFTTTTVSYNDANNNPGIFRHQIVDAVRSGDYVYLLTTTQNENWFSSQSHLYFWASTDGGATFKNPQKVNIIAVNEGYYAPRIQDADYSPNLAASGAEANIVWLNYDNPGGFDGWNAATLRTRRSTDAGTTLEAPITLHTFPEGYNQGGYAGQETIVRSGSNVYILTVKGDAPAGTYLWRSTDGGATWGAEQRISTGGWWPQIQLENPKVHITNSSYFYSKDSGATFNGGVNPHFGYGGWWNPQMALGADGAAHYVGMMPTAGTNLPSEWILYRRLAPPPAPGAANKALHLTTTDSTRWENMQVPAGPDTNFTTAMTVEFWVKRISGDYPFSQALIDKKRLSGAGSYMVGAWDGGFQIYSRIVTDQTDNYWGAWLGTGVPLPQGKWTHLAMTYDANAGSDNWRIYVDGVLSGKATVTGNILTDTMDSPLIVGKSTNGGSAGEVEIDELRLWRRALTQAELKAYMSGVTGTESGLRAYYNFNATTKDITGHGNDGVLMYKETYVSGQTAPAAPAGLSARAISPGAIVLSWNDKSPNEKGFEIDRAAGVCPGTGWKTVGRIGWDETTYTSTGLAANTTYAFRVRAFNSQDSAVSNCVSDTTAAVGTPKSPGNLQAVSIGGGKIKLTWKDISGNETGFKIFRKKGAGTWVLIKPTIANADSYTDGAAVGNEAANLYSYYLKACNGSGCSPATNTATVPFKPGNLSAVVASSTQVDLSWTDGSSNETGFQVHRKAGTCAEAGTWSLVTTTAANASAYSDTSVSSGSVYSYKVRAYTRSSSQPYANGYSGYTACTSVTTP